MRCYFIHSPYLNYMGRKELASSIGLIKIQVDYWSSRRIIKLIYFAHLLKTRQVKSIIALIHGVPYRKASISLPLSQNVSRQKSKWMLRDDMPGQIYKWLNVFNRIRWFDYKSLPEELTRYVFIWPIGYPVAGDRVYGRGWIWRGQLLHAHQLSFVASLNRQRKPFLHRCPMTFSRS